MYMLLRNFWRECITQQSNWLVVDAGIHDTLLLRRRKARQFSRGVIFVQSTGPTAVQTLVTFEKRARKLLSE